MLTRYSRALSIARSHALAENNLNALALLHHAHTLAESAAQVFAAATQPLANTPLNIAITADAARSIASLLASEVQRYRALVYIQNRDAPGEDVDVSVPLIDRLGEYPAGGVDLENIVEYPPKLPYIPAKPIFLDVAWNYIEYPGRRTKDVERNAEEREVALEEAPAPQKRGWFGFGR